MSGSTDYTVFAPTNEAFAQLLNDLGVSSLDEIPVDVLQQVLLYHVVSGKVYSSDISAAMVPTLQGSNLNVTTDGGIKVNGVPVVGPFDVKATNGVIHTINQVLMPPSNE